MKDAQELPALLRDLLYVALIGLAAIALPYLGRSYGPLDATEVLDTWIIAFVVVMIARGRTRAYVLLGVLVIYLLTRIIPAAYTDAPIRDFLQAYRWVLYLIAIALAYGRTWGKITGLIRVTWILAIAATLKAAATLVLIGPGERPGLLLENNFELALFCGLAAALYGHIARRRGLLIVLLGVLTVLSGSRSGAVVFVILTLYAVTQLRSLSLFSRYLIGIAGMAVTTLPVIVFTQRQQGAKYGIDRLNFLSVFLGETRDWGIVNWLFGTVPITHLSDSACLKLSNYPLLFSSQGDGTCYVVILHAFLLRVVFDAGLLGLALALVVPWVVMRRSGVTKWLTLTLTCIAIANGASVSGLNNPYVALPILIAVMTAIPSAQAEPKLKMAESPTKHPVGRSLRR